MVFQIEGICTAYNSQKKFSLSNFFGNLNFLKCSKYTPGLIGLNNIEDLLISGNKPHILVLNKKDLVFNKEASGKKRKNVKNETFYLQDDIRQTILNNEPRLSDVIFTNCNNIRCDGLQSVS